MADGLAYSRGIEMKSAEDYKQEIRNEISPSVVADAPAQPELILFFSFDLVNSTTFKSSEPKLWPLVFNKFYELANRELKSKLPDSRLWKYNGDEVLYYSKPARVVDIYKSVEVAFDCIASIKRSLNNLYSQTKDQLSIKAILWSAVVQQLAPQSLDSDVVVEHEGAPNISFAFTNDEGQSAIDFLGPDIDLGFRLAKHISREKLLVSSELTYFLSRAGTPSDYSSKFLERFKIVSYERLQGIWGGRA